MRNVLHVKNDIMGPNEAIRINRTQYEISIVLTHINLSALYFIYKTKHIKARFMDFLDSVNLWIYEIMNL